VTAVEISPSSSVCRCNWSSPWVSKPPIEQKKHCRDRPSRLRAEISRAIMLQLLAEPGAREDRRQLAARQGLRQMRWFSIERPTTSVQACSSRWLRGSESVSLIAADSGSPPLAS
jgi:hypothetical protein